MKWFYEYLKIVRDGKPISREVRKALDRVPYYIAHFNYNKEYVTKIIAFIENNLYEQKGSSENNPHPIKLQIEQKFWIELLGFEHDDGLPVINDLGLILGAGSGKSTFMACLGIAVMMVGSHNGNDVLVLSNSVKQSQELFRTAQEMVSDERSNLYFFKQQDMIQPIINKIRWTPTNSQLEIKAMDNRTADGVNVRMAIFDEFHSYTVNVIENIRKSSSVKRKNTGFTTVYISTNGQTRESVFDSYYNRWEKILDGELDDWATFPMIYKMDDINETLNKDLYPKAMPFINEISNPNIVYENFKRTNGNPTAQSEFLAKSFNIPQSQFNALFTTEQLRNASEPQDVEFTNNVAVGFDLSAVDDLSSIVLMYKNDDKLKIVNHNFIPSETFNERTSRAQRQTYAKFISEGSLELIEGSEIKGIQVYEWLDRYIVEHHLNPIGFIGDAFYSQEFRTRIKEDYGDDMLLTLRQTVTNLSPPLKELKARLQGGNIELTSDLLVWAFNNLRVRVDANGNIFPNKEKSKDKIDPVVASIEALHLWNDKAEEFAYSW